MLFQGYQGEADPQKDHRIQEADDRAQVMQLTQGQLAQIVSGAASEALTQHVQQQ